MGSFSLNPRALEAGSEVLLGTHGEENNEAHEPSTPPNGLDPPAADLQHEISDTILHADDRDSLVPMSPSEAEAPASSRRWDSEHLPPNWFSWKKLWKFTGPGFLMSIAYIVSPFYCDPTHHFL